MATCHTWRCDGNVCAISGMPTPASSLSTGLGSNASEASDATLPPAPSGELDAVFASGGSTAAGSGGPSTTPNASPVVAGNASATRCSLDALGCSGKASFSLIAAQLLHLATARIPWGGRRGLPPLQLTTTSPLGCIFTYLVCLLFARQHTFCWSVGLTLVLQFQQAQRESGCTSGMNDCACCLADIPISKTTHGEEAHVAVLGVQDTARLDWDERWADTCLEHVHRYDHTKSHSQYSSCLPASSPVH